MKNLVFVLVLVCGVVAIVLSYFKFAQHLWFPALLLFVMGSAVLFMCFWLLRFLQSQEIPIEVDPSVAATVGQSGTIVMKTSEREISDTLYWVVGCIYGAVWFVYYPDTLWRWWISYPAAFLLILLVPILLFVVMGQNLERIVADDNGIEVRTVSRSITTVNQKAVWRDVDAVKMVEYWAQEPNSSDNSQLHSKFVKKELVLLGRDGKELLKLADPLDPPQIYRRFLDSIPVWTKLAIQNERVET